jgi:RNA polymerase sigma-70 factor (ECF subfamily)
MGGRRGAAPDFLEVYDEHVWQVYAFFAYRLGGRDDAEDLTQLTFERALAAWGRFDPDRAKPLTWLLAIANNALVDHYRRGAKRAVPVAEPGEIIDLQGHAPAGFGDLGVDGPLAAALATLGDRERQVIALRFGADLAGAEIASVLDVSVANVHQILSRALRKLRAALDDVHASEATAR